MSQTIQVEYIDKYGAKRKEIIEDATDLRETQGKSHGQNALIAIRPEKQNITIEGVKELISPQIE